MKIINTLSKIFLKIINRLGLLKYINTSVSVNLFNKYWSFPIYAGVGFEFLYMKNDLLVKTINYVFNRYDIKTFVDVGVNIGQTLVKVKSKRSAISYYGFEINPNNFFYLRSLIAGNNLADVNIFPFGLSDGFEYLSFYLNNPLDTSASIAIDNRPGYFTDKMNSLVVPFDDFLENNKSLADIGQESFIKIDVEGAEVEVLIGMRKHIKVCRPIVLIEILDSHNQETLESVDKERKRLVLEFCDEMNLAIFQFDGTELISIDKFLDKLYSKSNNCDYLLIPKEIA